MTLPFPRLILSFFCSPFLDEQPASNQRAYTIDFPSDLISYPSVLPFFNGPLLARLIDTKWNDEYHYTLVVIFEDIPAEFMMVSVYWALMVVTCGKGG